jgi:hypothetical protein
VTELPVFALAPDRRAKFRKFWFEFLEVGSRLGGGRLPPAGILYQNMQIFA